MDSLSPEDREVWTMVLTCSQCGQPLGAPACGPTHAVLAADPTQHRNFPPPASDTPGDAA